MKQLISRRSFLKAAGVTAAAASMAIGAPAASACWYGDKSDVTILYTNDVHTYIDKQSPKLTYAAIADLKQSYQNAGKDVLLVDAGDHVQGTAYGSMDEGASIIKLMNAAGYDVATPGNHEFDYGMDRAKAICHRQSPLVSEKARMNQACKQFLCSSCRNNHCKMFVGFALANELDRTVNQRKQGMVFAHADVFARMDGRAALTHDDAASVDSLSTVNFHAQSFRFGFTTVAGGTAAFFMCHFKTPV